MQTRAPFFGIALGLSLVCLGQVGCVREAPQPASPPKGPKNAVPLVQVTPDRGATLAHDRIVKALLEPTTLEFVETPLEDVIEHLQDRHKIPIQIDEKALEASGVPKDTPVTRNLRGITLRSALSLILKQLNLTYVNYGEVLMITSPEAANYQLSPRLYSLEGIIGKDFSPEDVRQGILELLSAGYPSGCDLGNIPMRFSVVRDRLLVHGSEELHNDVMDILQLMHEKSTPVRVGE